MAPPSHTEDKKKRAVQELTAAYLNEEAVKRAGIFDSKRIQDFLTGIERDSNRASLTRKDAILNHLLSLQILHNHFI